MPKNDKAFKRFFLNGNLHRLIHQNRSQNVLSAFDFVDGKVKTYPFSEVELNKVSAFKISEAAKILGRSQESIRRYCTALDLKLQREYAIHNGRPGTHFISEPQLIKIREYAASLHRGRPRNDGRVTNSSTPTREELKSMIQSNRMLYVKENEEFVPVWRARQW
jgi:hypothetical protein